MLDADANANAHSRQWLKQDRSPSRSAQRRAIVPSRAKRGPRQTRIWVRLRSWSSHQHQEPVTTNVGVADHIFQRTVMNVQPAGALEGQLLPVLTFVGCLRRAETVRRYSTVSH